MCNENCRREKEAFLNSYISTTMMYQNIYVCVQCPVHLAWLNLGATNENHLKYTCPVVILDSWLTKKKTNDCFLPVHCVTVPFLSVYMFWCLLLHFLSRFPFLIISILWKIYLACLPQIWKFLLFLPLDSLLS